MSLRVLREGPEERERWKALVDFWGNKRVHVINAPAADFFQDLLELL